MRKASEAVNPMDGQQNSIQHVRKDLTISSYTMSLLLSKITFSGLKLEGVISGGGFHKVWRARWKGTPVAVKTVSRAVLEEFIA